MKNPVPRKYRAKAGYDLRLVPKAECLFCDKAIDRRAWVEIKILARFGTMLVAHKSCDEAAK